MNYKEKRQRMKGYKNRSKAYSLLLSEGSMPMER